MKNQIEPLNQSLFLRIDAGAGTPVWILDAAILTGDDLIYLIPMRLLALRLWSDGAKRKLVIEVCLVAMLGVGINQIIGLVWLRPRPLMIGPSRAWIPHAADSFPSDHLIVLAGVGLMLLRLAARLYLTILARQIHAGWMRR